MWNIEVLDPAGLTKPEVGGRTEQAMTEMAGSLGCVFVQCWDDDTVDGCPTTRGTAQPKLDELADRVISNRPSRHCYTLGANWTLESRHGWQEALLEDGG